MTNWNDREILDGPDEIEFECTNTEQLKTFSTAQWTPHYDGSGYFDVECDVACPYCGETHWEQR